MRILLAVVLVGIAGCGGDNSPDDVAVSTPKSSQAKTDKSPAQTPDADPVAALKKIGAKIKRDEQGEVVEVVLPFSDITDSGLVQLKGLPKLQTLDLDGTKITAAGLAHLKGLTSLQKLNLGGTRLRLLKIIGDKRFGSKVTDAGIADLKKALPNCKITK